MLRPNNSVIFCRRILVIACFSLAGVLNLSAQEVKRPKIAERDIYKRSDILVSGGKHTLIPKTCAIHVPDVHKSKFKDKASGSFVRLSEFYKANFGWLHLHEVTLDQARGKAPIPKEKLEALKKTGKVIIAVYKKNPITVKEYTPPKEEE